jgi:hypothetical protein
MTVVEGERGNRPERERLSGIGELAELVADHLVRHLDLLEL